MSHNNDTVRLAGQAASLSNELYIVQERCQHETTAAEISMIADELARLSTTLWHLNDAINADPTQYTQAFDEDLTEITNELTSVFEEVSQCCEGLQSADSNMSAVSWFFKKGRVTRLLKHLEALKSTLVVMRTVLWHGKDYGTHTSDRVAEANPHTMREDRVILESVLARNRSAILDLHNLTDITSRSIGKQLERTPSKAGDYHRHLSESTGVEIPPIPDVLPPSAADLRIDQSPGSLPQLQRTFSKRGVRLGVHMSILDLSAHEAPSNLEKKWVQQAHLRQQLVNTRSGARGGLTALPGLSRISEVDTAAGSSLNLTQIQTEPAMSIIPMSSDAETPKRTPGVPFNTPAGGLLQEIANISSSRSNSSATLSSILRRAMSKMSMSSLRSPGRSKSRSRGESEASTTSTLEVKQVDHDPGNSTARSAGDSPTSRARRSILNIDQENRPFKKPLFETIKQKFEKSPLSTPEREKDSEYGKV